MTAAMSTLEGPDRITGRVVAFQGFLREHGYQAGIPESLAALEVARHVNVTDRHRLRAGLRSLNCCNQGEWARFDELFDAYWLPPNRTVLREATGGSAGEAHDRQEPSPRTRLLDDVRQGAGDASRIAADGDSTTQGGATAAESLAQRDFRHITREDELQALERLVDRLAARMRRRMVRRQQTASRGDDLHLRRTLRNSLQFGGEPIELSFRRRRRKAPHLVLLLDVSRSMSIYTYVMLRFVRALVLAFRQADAFVFHTRLVPVTDALKEKHMERMRDRLTLLSAGWSGGTRIGESIAEFNDEYAPRLVGRRSVVVVLSDGFDTGEAAQLGEQMRRLQSRARRVIWLNPLLGRCGYTPTAGGMAAALPWLDLFAPAHNLESLLALEHELIRV